MDFLERAKGALARARLPPVEQKVFDATNADPWGPHGTVLGEIARCTASPDERQQVLSVLWRRLAEEKPDQWRVVYKALAVVEYLVANGSEAVVEELRSNGARRVAPLNSFHYKDPEGKDQGINVRHKSALLVQLLSDREKIDEARAKAAANRNKYGGVSADDMRSTQGFPAAPAAEQSGEADDDFKIRDTAVPGARVSDVDGASAAPKFRVTMSSAPRAAPGPAPKLSMTLPPPGSKAVAPPLPPPKPFAPPPPPAPAAAPAFDAFGLGTPAPPPLGAAFGGATALRPQAPAPPPPPPAMPNLLDLLDAPAPSGAPGLASLGAFPPPAAAAAPPAVALDVFSSLASLTPVAGPPPLAQRPTPVDPFAPLPPLDPFHGLSAPIVQPAAGGLRPPTLGAGPALGLGGQALGPGSTARKPASLDDTLNASLANLGLTPFPRP